LAIPPFTMFLIMLEEGSTYRIQVKSNHIDLLHTWMVGKGSSEEDMDMEGTNVAKDALNKILYDPRKSKTLNTFSSFSTF
jgi:hypothetical protein